MLVDRNFSTDENIDVFAQDAALHQAFREPPAFFAHIYEKLFDCFLDGQLFGRWVHHRDRWQLDVVGGPGSGKTTFAGLAVQRIRHIYAASIGRETHLAVIFIPDELIDHELMFLEDLIANIYRQLAPTNSAVGSITESTYEMYCSSQYTGERASRRIDLIAKALRFRVAEVANEGYAFLVIDHLDQCRPSLQELVRCELMILQDKGLKILATSRLPRYETPLHRWCDSSGHEGHEPIQVYWRCSNCGDDICDVCKKDQRACAECADGTGIWEEPLHCTILIDSISMESLAGFIAWDLEREHGELGLGSSNTTPKPPLSSFGLAFKATKQKERGGDWIQKIASYVDGSLVLAKLALDRIHNSTSPDAIDLSPKRLPKNMQAHFYKATQIIEQRSGSHNSTVALKSIAAVGKEGDPFIGLRLSHLARLLKERPHQTKRKGLPPRSPEDVINLANGYLKLLPSLRPGEECSIAAFHRLFWLFVYDEYDEELIMAYAQLRASKIPRSLSFQSSIFQDHRKSPALRHRRSSSHMLRSHSHISSARLVTSPPIGLGLKSSGSDI